MQGVRRFDQVFPEAVEVGARDAEWRGRREITDDESDLQWSATPICAITGRCRRLRYILDGAGAITGVLIAMFCRPVYRRVSGSLNLALPLLTLPTAVALFGFFVWVIRAMANLDHG